ncbi:sulfatase-like hydrolase/transferase [Anaerovorax odorimutans]|uniref:sulfatase-like hydrolase/transferase n=1 Tax=Anaerovorax odorimutans TaxID=109327 RepID=UPI000423CA6E|nr:sulfatase-like hydrolase/transferase [Anaerovorax odorimutans]
MENIKNLIYKIKENGKGFYNIYGILGFILAAAVPLKLLLFYKLIGIATNFVLIWIITCILTLLLFTSFKNKWIPAVVYTLLTILMFADVTYSSFFNRYLSVAMIGAAGVLGDITESIKEVLRPAFFLLFADIVLLFITLVYGKIKNREKIQKQAELEKKNCADRNIVYRLKLKFRSIITLILILLIIVCNITNNGLITSISNQEIYSFHIKDIVNKIKSNNDTDINYISAFEDNYKNEKDGPLFGIAKDRNLIVIQVESLQNFVINRTYNGQEITPNLNALLKDQGTLYFDNYYQQIGSGNTSDAELATNNSIYGSLSSYSYKLFQDNYYRGLPVLLGEKGYSTASFHAFWDTDFWNRAKAYPNLGFQHFFGGINGLDNDSFDLTKKMGWGLVDDEFFKQSIQHIKNLPQPFYSFLITLSNHHPFVMLDEYDFIDLLPEDKDTTVGNYINSVAYTDYSIGVFLQQLKDEGLYDNSVIAIYGDHLGLTLKDDEIKESMTRVLDKEYDFDTMMNIPLIITIPGLDNNINQTISVAGGQLDFFPTMAYLMGFDSLDTIYLGHNLLSVKDGFVAEQTYMTKGSFFSGDIAYEMSRDGVFENGRAWNIRTGESVPVQDCYEGYLKSMDIINASEYILKNDVLRKVYKEGKSASTAFSENIDREYPDEIAVAGAPNMDLVGTNSLEALDASYDEGHRYIKVEISWTSEIDNRVAVLLSDWSNAPNYFETDNNTEMTYDEFSSLEMKNGLTPMTYKDLADWMSRHKDVTIIVKAERSADYFMRIINEYMPGINDRIIPEVPGMVEYSGLYNAILYMDKGNFTDTQLLEFMDMNNVWAGSMTEESAKGKYKSVLDSDNVIYVYEVNDGLLTKRNPKCN